MKELSRYKAMPLIRETKGQIFACRFKKLDGTLRSMVCIVPPPKKNAKRASPAKENNSYILVRDVVIYKGVLTATKDKKIAIDASYRLINLATLTHLTIDGTSYTITN